MDICRNGKLIEGWFMKVKIKSCVSINPDSFLLFILITQV